MNITIKKDISPGEEIWTGIPGRYIPAPEEPGTYDFIEECHEDERGQLVHDYFTFVRKGDA